MFTKLSNPVSLIISFVMLIALIGGLSVGPVNGQDTEEPSNETPVTAAIFGSVGVSYGQTAQLNVANFHPGESMFPPDPVRPTEVELRIIDGGGEILARQTTMLQPGGATVLRVDRNMYPSIAARRMNLRALVLIKHTEGFFRSELIVPTFEVINNDSGISSTFVNPASIVGFNPQPEPPGQRRISTSTKP